ncbi:JAB domain-containing protein [Niabella beijingensis]|uniref:JAB domain-containing protein n=1 Tax=Niabella beijingensis TaxID=2872700 RepID=UPI001CC0F91A|nr:JAB domain-containing protein [Niabella beijingensis]MBZ4187648.1 JAB domain-containing protein [Niabella beijingensis]
MEGANSKRGHNEVQNINANYLVPTLHLSYSPAITPAERILIADAETAARVFYSLWNQSGNNAEERFKIMLLDEDSGLIGVDDLDFGWKSKFGIDPAIVYRKAVAFGARFVILSQYLPDGPANPTKEDLILCNQLIQAGLVLRIPFRDHMIISRNGSYWHSASLGDH